MNLDDCPFCGTNAVFKTVEDPFDKTQYICGCTKLGCRGNINHSPSYYEFDDMWEKWNRRITNG